MISDRRHARTAGGTLITWIYDDIGCPGAILDEFCIRNLAGHPVGWVFGLSMFSLGGEHLGWAEDGVFYDIDNRVLGFVPGATGLALAAPALAPEPPLPVLSKRPCVPGLRGRSSRPAGKGWSTSSLASYLACGGAAALTMPALRCRSAAGGAAHCDLSI
jgi:hypothetical protein